jgi:hypothetical protein
MSGLSHVLPVQPNPPGDPKIINVICLYIHENPNRSSWNLAYLLSRVGYVTRLITSLCQGCSDHLLDFASTIMHFTIIPLVLCVLLSWLTSSGGESIQRSLAVAGSRLTRSSSKLGFYNFGHCYAMDLLFIRRFEQIRSLSSPRKRVCCPRQRPTLIALSLWERSMYSL